MAHLGQHKELTDCRGCPHTGAAVCAPQQAHLPKVAAPLQGCHRHAIDLHLSSTWSWLRFQTSTCVAGPMCPSAAHGTAVSEISSSMQWHRQQRTQDWLHENAPQTCPSMLREAMCEPAWTYSLAAHAVFADCGAGPPLPCQVSVRQSYAALTMLHALTQLEQHSHVMPTAALSQSHAMIDV